MVRATVISLVGCGVLTISGTALADEMSMSFETPGVYGNDIHYSYDPTGSHTNPLFSGDTTAGRSDWTVVSEGPVSFGGHIFNNGDQFSTFTAELTGFMTPGQTYSYSAVAVRNLPGEGSALGFFRAGLLQELFDNRFRQAINGSTTEAAAFRHSVSC